MPMISILAQEFQASNSNYHIITVPTPCYIAITKKYNVTTLILCIIPTLKGAKVYIISALSGCSKNTA